MDLSPNIKNAITVLKWLVVGVVGILVATVLLNVCGNFLFRYVPFIADMKDKGSLGDAMNGLSAPLIAFMSAILVYYTFKEQNKANQMQNKTNLMIARQWHFDTVYKLYTDIGTDY